jgi:hypothetical protein
MFSGFHCVHSKHKGWRGVWCSGAEGVNIVVSVTAVRVSQSGLRTPSGSHDQIFAVVWTVAVLNVVGRPSWQRTGLSGSRSQSLSVLAIYIMCTFVCVVHFNMHTRPASPGFVQQIMPSSYIYLCINSSLHIWTVICLTTAKFQSFKFPVLGFTLTYVLERLYFRDFMWLLPASCMFFCYIIINIRNFERQT